MQRHLSVKSTRNEESSESCKVWFECSDIALAVYLWFFICSGAGILFSGTPSRRINLTAWAALCNCLSPQLSSGHQRQRKSNIACQMLYTSGSHRSMSCSHHEWSLWAFCEPYCAFAATAVASFAGTHHCPLLPNQQMPMAYASCLWQG